MLGPLPDLEGPQSLAVPHIQAVRGPRPHHEDTVALHAWRARSLVHGGWGWKLLAPEDSTRGGIHAYDYVQLLAVLVDVVVDSSARHGRTAPAARGQAVDLPDFLRPSRSPGR